MRITNDRLIRLRWLLLSAVGAGACGGTVHSTPDEGGGGSDAVAGSRSNDTAGVAGEPTTGGKPSIAGSAGVAGHTAGRNAGGAGAGGAGAGGAGGADVPHGECVDP